MNRHIVQKTKILTVADSPALLTGKAEAVGLIFGNLTKRWADCYEISQIALLHTPGLTQSEWTIHRTRIEGQNGGKRQFAQADLNGQETFAEVVKVFRPDIVFAINEPGKLVFLCAPPGERPYQVILLLPFDGFPVSPRTGQLLNEADLILVPSDFSKQVITACLPDVDAARVATLYCPVDTDRFQPASREEKAELRQDLLPPWMPRDAFILGCTGRNTWAKQIWTLYKTVSCLRKGNYAVCSACGKSSLIDQNVPDSGRVQIGDPGACSRPEVGSESCPHCGFPNIAPAKPLNDVFLWLHTPLDDAHSAWPVQLLENQFDVRPGRDVHYTEGYGVRSPLAPENMPYLYQLWDCLLYLSGGEGLALSAWEAMSCGIPVVYTNYSAQGEIVGRANGGLPVGGTLQPEPKCGAFRMVADVSQAIDAVRKLYFDPDLRQKLGLNGRQFAEQHGAHVQAERWHEMFQQVLRGDSNGQSKPCAEPPFQLSNAAGP